jgi:hypothetical protein
MKSWRNLCGLREIVVTKLTSEGSARRAEPCAADLKWQAMRVVLLEIELTTMGSFCRIWCTMEKKGKLCFRISDLKKLS